MHQGVIEDCGSKAGISLFIQVTMCLSNITCCLDAVCYYFIAHEVRSSKKTFRLSRISQRKNTCSTSEVWTILQTQFEHTLYSEGCSRFEWNAGNAQRVDAGFRMRPLWKVRSGKEAGQMRILMNCTIKISRTADCWQLWPNERKTVGTFKTSKICDFQMLNKWRKNWSFQVPPERQ